MVPKPAFPPVAALEGAARRAIVTQVQAIFNDRARGERPVARSRDSWFEPGSPIWRVHGDVTTMMVGGIAALLLQMLHPAVLAGVWDHSNFRTDMAGRLRRTARFIAVTTYGARDEAEAMIARIDDIHRRVAGVTAAGRPYSAADPRLLAWVHVTEATSFLAAWQRYGDRPLSAAECDRYYAEFALIAARLGADPVPRTAAEAAALIAAMRPELAADARSREVAGLILAPPARTSLVRPFQQVTTRAAIDLLPAWARTMHGLSGSGLGRPLVDAGARGLAGTLRWAFGG